MPNPSKILGHVWNKDDDTLELLAKPFPQEHPVTKRTILSYLGTVYDPLGIISPTMAEGKHIYREACDEKKGWNAEVSLRLKNQWLRWTKQLKDVRVPRSIASFVGEIGAVHLHIFADASILACCAAAIAVVEHEAGVSKGLLTSKSRISKRSTSIARLELVSGHMAVKHGEEPQHCSPAMAHSNHQHLDGRYGSTILDNQSWERMEGVCIK